LEKTAKHLLHADSRFWVVRPQIGAGGISGIDTLLSGVYVGLDPGKSSNTARTYTALDNAPMITSGESGRSFTLTADDLNSINVGSPIYFRHIQVGHVADYQLDKHTRSMAIRFFINAPYDQFVNATTRFWNASGVDVSLTAAGLKLSTQSLATIIAGGVAFDDPPGATDLPEAQVDSSFALAADRQSAMADPDGSPLLMQMRFPGALRGLQVGAPVEFVGVNAGDVRKIALDYDPATRKFSILVDVALYGHRLGNVLDKLPTGHGDQQKIATFLAALVGDGLRAQARTGNLLTGQLYIALDFVPHPSFATFDINSRPMIIPTAPGSLDKLQEQLGDIIAKFQKIPFDSIGQGVNHDVTELGKTLELINSTTLPQASTTLKAAGGTLHSVDVVLSPDSTLQANLNQLLLELTRTSESFRGLSDLLSEHPESLIRGRIDSPTAPGSPPIEQPAPAGIHP
jgi:paraquat-inducible protein B